MQPHQYREDGLLCGTKMPSFRATVIYLLLHTLVLPVASQQNSTYNTFDFFKNTHLEQCSYNASIQPDPANFFVIWQTADASSPNSYCKYLSGYPVVLPTTPTLYAFYPFWPTYGIQAISMLVSGLGLWWSFRKQRKSPEKEFDKLPKSLWIQIPFDIARLIAWWVQFSRSVGNLEELPWMNVILWQIPLTYTSILHQCLKPDLRPQPRLGRGRSRRLQLREPPPKQSVALIAAISIMTILTTVQWLASGALILLHLIHAGNSLAYKLNATAISDPASLGSLLSPCQAYLADGNLPKKLFFTAASVMAIATLTAQFIITSLVLGVPVVFLTFTLISGRLVREGRSDDFFTTQTISLYGVLATQFSLWIPAFFTLVFVTARKEVDVAVTNDLSVTGGCTFAVVAMWELWGYWDVKYHKAWRVVLSVLGVS